MFSYYCYGLVNVNKRTKKNHKNDPFLGSFLATEPDKANVLFRKFSPSILSEKNKILVLGLFLIFGHI